MAAEPMFVHCCHCSWCQRETGTAFALNAMVEASHVELLQGSPELIDTPTASGGGQQIARCPTCRVAVWSHYSAAKQKVCFVRVGSLDDTSQIPPDIHIFTSTKQPWVRLNDDAPVVPEFYRRAEVWSDESLSRYFAAIE